MRPQELIAKKRDGARLSADEINVFIDGVCDRSWAHYQISAMIMAMFIQGLNRAEQDALTQAMLYSGSVMDFSDIDAPKADKHSTGGVGDKTSLLIAPMAAACGIAVPMVSGRGLGHTGGTLDKLESIEGYNVKLTQPQFKKLLKSCGFALGAQTARIAPADKKIYALRDATATVPYIPLIVASVMSKKLAEGLDALILDVKTGTGAFMQDHWDSEELAKQLVSTGNGCGVRTEAVVSDMNQPLGKFVGNAVEVYECLKLMRGEGDKQMSPTLELSVELTARMLVLCDLADTVDEAKTKVGKVLDSGEALERFKANVGLQGGDPRVCDKPEKLLEKKLKHVEIKAAKNGYITGIDTLAVGQAVCDIGGGRVRAEDKIDHAVGFACEAGIGDKIAKDQTLGILYCRDKGQAEWVYDKLVGAYRIESKKPAELKLIKMAVSE
jgi:pyrimidine-nucleoside phosphorylase